MDGSPRCSTRRGGHTAGPRAPAAVLTASAEAASKSKKHVSSSATKIERGQRTVMPSPVSSSAARRVRRAALFSYANAIAPIAVFIALGGNSYAVATGSIASG
jgi:hypothetical protein